MQKQEKGISEKSSENTSQHQYPGQRTNSGKNYLTSNSHKVVANWPKNQF